MAIIKYSPLDIFEDFDRDWGAWPLAQRQVMSPALDVYEDKDSVVVETPLVGASGQAQFRNQLNVAQAGLGNALDNVLSVRATAGGRLNELDSLENAGSDLRLQYQATLSQLQDTDYNEAVSRLSRQQVSLQAAQQTFTKVAGLSLFNYL